MLDDRPLSANCSQIEVEQQNQDENGIRTRALIETDAAATTTTDRCAHSSAAAAASADIDSSMGGSGRTLGTDLLLDDAESREPQTNVGLVACVCDAGEENVVVGGEGEVGGSWRKPQQGPVCRAERSNSCSQAELGAVTAAHSMALATAAATSSALPVGGGGGVGGLSASSTMVNTDDACDELVDFLQKQQQATTSASQENLAQNKLSNCQIPTIASSASASNLIDIQYEHCNTSGIARDISCNEEKGINKQQKSLANQQHQQEQKQQQQQQQQQQSSSYYSQSSRFFSSKLNTGSLWSLLSVGSNSSYSDQAGANTTNDNMDSHLVDNNNLENKHSSNVTPSSSSSSSSAASSSAQTSVGAFFSRNLQFKRNNHTSGQAQQKESSSISNSNSNSNNQDNTERDKTNGIETNNNQSQATAIGIKRFRFNNVKYIGSTILHKNFTLPMLEWIAKDIRRQTIRGAQCVSQRQFNIPTREIIFEIQSNSLTAISCKDGHPIFIHPMSCISKYVQLQHDQTCFSYFIRDTKESPYYCHVFQAKSASKVHDIFQAIRESTTTTAAAVTANIATAAAAAAAGGGGAGLFVSPFNLQKSLSTDGSFMMRNSNSLEQQTSAPFNKQALSNKANLTFISQQQQQQNAAAAVAAAHQFEDSYQFEVMFVKKVKLQCRRVPASFVDDALETLKSFEVLKGGVESKANQIKGSVGKRPIISASVDERQEYDEACQSPTPGSGGQTENSHHYQAKLGTISSSKNSKSSSSTESNSETNNSNETNNRRGSSASLHKLRANNSEKSFSTGNNESRSCQQSPTKLESDCSNELKNSKQQKQEPSLNNEQQQHKDEQQNRVSSIREQIINMKKHQSMDCLKSFADFSIKTAKAGNAPNYTNDFSPYSTITSNDLNERIAAIPVVSTSSVSLDHETRQKLARQVRETIMATAASIKKDVYSSGDKLDSISTSKALDSLSCTVTSSVPPVFNTDQDIDSSGLILDNNQARIGSSTTDAADNNYWLVSDQRRSSAGPLATATSATNQLKNNQQTDQSGRNNFDLFRRASARQVVKNRTMLLLIGKDELCTISIDKHQMLFSKSFSSIVLCLQGNNNKDHFGLICRDSGKINPQTESYAGFIFKCQSDKVAREIMGALKQVIYNSQHNQYHGITSPYNPLNANKFKQAQPLGATKVPETTNKTTHDLGNNTINSSTRAMNQTQNNPVTAKQQAAAISLASKRGFLNSIDLDEAARQSMALEPTLSTTPPSAFSLNASYPFHQSVVGASSGSGSPSINHHATQQHQQQQQPKNFIKSMFCDNCPLYWYHRLCCDIESLPADASKTIILRRIDTSLPEKEQDEIYSKFSEFNIETIEEHNEIFMSLLRHLSEKKQLKHNQSILHQNAMAKNQALLRQQLSISSVGSATPLGNNAPTFPTPLSSSSSFQNSAVACSTSVKRNTNHTHQRSGSTSGSMAFVLNQSSNVANQSIVEASTAAIDNLKKAKNSISVSIENMLKRRSSLKDENNSELEFITTTNDTTDQGSDLKKQPPTRAGSFKMASSGGGGSSSRPNTRIGLAESSSGGASGMDENKQAPLKRSQSTSDYSNGPTIETTTNNNSSTLSSFGSNWKNSFVNRTMNYKEELSSNSLVGLFRNRGSSFGSRNDELAPTPETYSQRTSSECLNIVGESNNSPYKQPGSPNVGTTLNRYMYPTNNQTIGVESNPTGGSTPSSMLSSAFWKKSIFDKIRQPTTSSEENEQQQQQHQHHAEIKLNFNETQKLKGSSNDNSKQITRKRTREELRALWRKAILEQITLIKMDKQNQRLQASAVQCDTQTIKLNYRDVPYSRDVLSSWDRLLKQDPTKKVEFFEVARLVRAGLPKQRRGEIWMFLMNQYQLRHGTCFQPADCEFRGDANQAYRSLLSQLSLQQHEIFVDIGRTFPSHPYYSQYLSIGQLSLFNLLKAYSLLDQEVGYCQGLSFVAGILLLHVDSEDEAFELMRHLLFNFGLRKQYLPSMNALHLQLYQLTRLLRDYEFELFSHFDRNDISPSLYAAPWFLTIFASQFPLNFVARLLDLVFLIGIEAIFRVSLNLLLYHKDNIIKCSSLESTMDYMRSELTKIADDKDLIRLFDKSMSLDLRTKLIEYEIEYTFYCAEDKARSSTGASHYRQQSYTKSSGSGPLIRKANELLHSHDKTEQQEKATNCRTNYSTVDNDGDEKENLLDEDKRNENVIDKKDNEEMFEASNSDSSTSVVADATATIIIQHLLANNHLKSLKTNYSY